MEGLEGVFLIWWSSCHSINMKSRNIDGRMPEWLRGVIRNHLRSACAGSSPAPVARFCFESPDKTIYCFLLPEVNYAS